MGLMRLLRGMEFPLQPFYFLYQLLNDFLLPHKGLALPHKGLVLPL